MIVTVLLVQNECTNCTNLLTGTVIIYHYITSDVVSTAGSTNYLVPIL